MATRFFQLYCRNELGESILGDLQERFDLDIERFGLFRARLRYWRSVISFVNRHTLRREQPAYQNSNTTAMIRNYYLVTIRNMRRNLTFSTINVFGLSIGLACCIIIFFYVKRELSFDQFHSKSERIYRITNEFVRSSKTFNWTMTPPPLAPALRNNFPEIEKVTRLRYSDDHHFVIGEKSFSEKAVFYADSLFLEIFDFEMVSGDRSALDEPNSVVLTASLAEKFFGTTEVQGEIVQLDGNRSLKVTGVMKDVPRESHIVFDMLISFSTYRVPPGYLADLNSWGWAGFLTYALLHENASLDQLASKIKGVYEENYRQTGRDLEVNILAQPLSDIYLGSNDMVSIEALVVKVGNLNTLYILSLIAAMILLIAGFNFMNLSTAMSMRRGKEIGIRKVMGALRGKVIGQFLFESVVIALLSLLCAFVIVLVARPYFSGTLGITIPTDGSLLITMGAFIGVAIVLGVLAGLYPSMMLSSFSSIAILKGGAQSGNSSAWVRKVLVVVQFAISLGLISASLILVQQLDFIRDKSLGFDKESVLQLRMNDETMARHYEALRNVFLQNPQVINLAQVSHQLDGSSGSGPAQLKGAPDSESRQLSYLQSDHDFLEVMNIELVEGRFFERGFTGDTTRAILLNETAVAEFGLTNPIGQQIIQTNQERTIIGVFKDFHFNSLHTPIAPLAIVMPFTNTELLFIKLAPGNISETLQHLEDDWKSITGNAPFDATFLDDNLNRMYEREENFSSLVSTFSALAVILACLGLYGLVAFSVSQKLKEIGVRKVLGASIDRLVFMLSRQYILIILIANVIAWPLTWHFANQWLSEFAYRIEVGIGVFVISALLLLTIAMITISHQTIRAALTNPVKVLRNE